MTKKFPKSIRKFLRREKAKIRRKFLDLEKQKEEIEKLYERIGRTNKQDIKEKAKTKRSKNNN